MNLEEDIKRCKELIKEEHSNWIGLSNQASISNVLSSLENSISKDKIMEYKKEAENAECKNALEAVCIGAIIGVLDGLLEE